MKTVNGILSLVGIGILAIFWFQNLEPQVDVILLGVPSRLVSLSTMLLFFYLAGIGIGLFLNVSWAFDDALLVRRIKRQFGKSGGAPSSSSSSRGVDSYRSRIDNNSAPEDEDPPIKPDILADGEEPGDWIDR